MTNKYKVTVNRFAKYHGESSENHKNGKIHEEQYNYLYDDYKLALDAYIEKCTESAKFLSLPISSFTQTDVVKLIDNTENNPNKAQEHLGLVVRQLTMSNL